jgi:hypothetical protein
MGKRSRPGDRSRAGAVWSVARSCTPAASIQPTRARSSGTRRRLSRGSSGGFSRGGGRPVCLACPMHALHRAGACALGTTTCLEYLPMANMSIYTESLAEAKKLEEASTTTEEGDR